MFSRKQNDISVFTAAMAVVACAMVRDTPNAILAALFIPAVLLDIAIVALTADLVVRILLHNRRYPARPYPIEKEKWRAYLRCIWVHSVLAAVMAVAIAVVLHPLL